MLDSIYKTWRWPRVVGKVEHDPKNPLEYAKIWRIAQQAAAAAGKPVKFGTCSAQVLAFFLDSHTPHYDLDDKKQLIWDMAEAMNLELRQLAASGCKVIQVEEPTLHFMARYNPEQKELLDFLVDAFNREVEGLDDVEVWIHTCWGNPNMQKVFSDESYANSMEIYLERLKGDVWTIEATENNFNEIVALRAVREPAEEEDRRRRHQPPHAAGRLSPTSSPSGSGAASSSSRPTSWCSRPTAASAGRASTGTWRSTRRSPSPGAQHRPQGARPRGALRPRGRSRAADGRPARPRAADPPAVTLGLRGRFAARRAFGPGVQRHGYGWAAARARARTS